MNKAEGKLLVEQKVEDFSRNREEYLHKSFNEARARGRFIDPFFQALGWDFDQTHLKPHLWDVHREVSQRDNTSTKKPDYAFRIDEKLKFFVEAKAPWVPLTDKKPVFQAKRYAFSTSGKSPIVILTDFEEFRVFNALQRPVFDNPLQGLLKQFDLKYTDYVEKWDHLYDHFSKEAVTEGSLDKLRGKLSKKTKGLDEEFLSDITGWREILAKNIAVRNMSLTVDEINEAVQRLLDRMVFIRNLEDRRIEPENLLLDIAERKTDIYSHLIPCFRRMDGDYNGLLFKKHFSEDMTVDDKVLASIIKKMCWPQSPFEFDVIEPEILGRIYERFLGSKIRLTDGHRAKVEEKPEVRHAGGVYYTPQYIVDYIVKNTVGRVIGGKSPDEIRDIRILDPACGSGSFLLGAFGYLMEYHKGWYGENRSKRKYRGDWFETPDGEIRLSLRKKGEILKNNIFGVDIDREATEVAMMSLYLKLLEEGFDKGQAMMFMKGHVLPDLTGNIKSGNSLIGSDYYKAQSLSLFSDEEMKKINAFDWEQEFRQIFPSPLTGEGEGGGGPSTASGQGFDCVIGNPPYVRQELLGDYKSYFQKRYQVYHGTADLYAYFIEHGVSLLKPDGYFSYIVANKWMRANYGKPLRQWMKGQCIVEIVDFGDLQVFKGATTYPCIINIQKEKPQEHFNVAEMKTLVFPSLEEYVTKHSFSVSQPDLDDNGWALVDDRTKNLLNKLISAGIPLGEYVNGDICYGIKTGFNKAFVIDEETRNRLISEDPKSSELIKPFLVGKDIKRYQSSNSIRYLIFTRRGVNIKHYPAIENYLLQFKKQLIPRPKNWSGGKWEGRKPGSYQWYEIQDTVDYYKEFEKPKIIIPAIVNSANYCYDKGGFYSNDKTSIIPTDDLYLLGLLNSKAVDFVLHSISSTKQGGYFEYKPMYVSQLPIRTIDFSNSEDKKRHDQIVELVDQMLESHRHLQNAKTDHDKNIIQRKIDMMDREIDRLVYDLYGLTEEEIRVVEGN